MELEGHASAPRRQATLGLALTPHPVPVARPGAIARLPPPEPARTPPGAALRAELDRDPAWMYPWRLGDDGFPPLLGPELPSIHQTRLEMMRAPVHDALAAAGPEPRVLDLATCEGWFAHRLLEWGAGEVVGIDIRPRSVRRAELMRDHFGIEASRLSFRVADVHELSPATLGTFDVVLNLGLVYHLEDPIGALRVTRRLTGGLCVLETQLTEQEDPIRHGWGGTDLYLRTPASFAVVWEDPEASPLASSGAVASLVPNLAALETSVRAAGFSSFEPLPAASWHNPQYRRGERFMAVLRP